MRVIGMRCEAAMPHQAPIAARSIFTQGFPRIATRFNAWPLALGRAEQLIEKAAVSQTTGPARTKRPFFGPVSGSQLQVSNYFVDDRAYPTTSDSNRAISLSIHCCLAGVLLKSKRY
jgi:hypothetical protein